MNHDFSFFASLDKPTTEAVQMVMAPGFGCAYKTADIWRPRGETNMDSWLPVTWYLRSLPKHPAGPFWLRFTSSGMEEDNPFKSLYKEAPHRIWQVEVGDIEIHDGQDWETPISGNSEFLSATFEFELLKGREDGVELFTERKEGELHLSDNPDLHDLELPLRQTLARGWFFMGAPLDQVLNLTGVELNAHEKMEWGLERRESVLDYLIHVGRDAQWFGRVENEKTALLKELIDERNRRQNK